MKGKILLFLYLFFSFLKITYQQPILIPIDPENLDDQQKDNSNNIKQQDDGKPIIITQEYKGKDGSNIRITRIHYGRSKNLNGKKSEGITPFQMMRIFDNRVNSIFEDMIRESLGLKILLNGFSMIDDPENDDEQNISKNSKNNTNDIFEDFELDDDEEENNKNIIDNKNITNDKNKKNEKRILKKDKNEKNIKRFGKLKINMDNVKKKMKKGKKQLSRKEIIFSKVCKYIFYSIILFTIYILVKKLLELLEIIEPDNQVEIKIENDETSKLKKNTENKQN